MGRIFDLNMIVASLGVILATMSLITGLHAVKKDKMSAVMIVNMHRMNGYLTCLIYLIVAGLSLAGNGGFRTWPVIGWAAGLGLIAVKILAVRNQKFYKYGSRLGIMLFIAWLFIIYRHITT